MEPGGIVARGYYSSAESPPAPVIPLVVYTPTSRRRVEVEAKVDTGFSGTLLLAFEKYFELGLQLYERAEKASGLVAGGYRVELRVSRGVVELGGLRIPCDIYTTIFARRSLVGRELLNKFKTVLDAPQGAVILEAGHR
ncbi:MAG: hypothetical protein QXU62_01195 [Thermofilaceae archaeon]